MATRTSRGKDMVPSLTEEGCSPGCFVVFRFGGADFLHCTTRSRRTPSGRRDPSRWGRHPYLSKRSWPNCGFRMPMPRKMPSGFQGGELLPSGTTRQQERESPILFSAPRWRSPEPILRARASGRVRLAQRPTDYVDPGHCGDCDSELENPQGLPSALATGRYANGHPDRECEYERRHGEEPQQSRRPAVDISPGPKVQTSRCQRVHPDDEHPHFDSENHRPFRSSRGRAAPSLGIGSWSRPTRSPRRRTLRDSRQMPMVNRVDKGLSAPSLFQCQLKSR